MRYPLCSPTSHQRPQIYSIGWSNSLLLQSVIQVLNVFLTVECVVFLSIFSLNLSVISRLEDQPLVIPRQSRRPPCSFSFLVKFCSLVSLYHWTCCEILGRQRSLVTSKTSLEFTVSPRIHEHFQSLSRLLEVARRHVAVGKGKCR